jgi:hypothetical protein
VNNTKFVLDPIRYVVAGDRFPFWNDEPKSERESVDVIGDHTVTGSIGAGAGIGASGAGTGTVFGTDVISFSG